MVRVCIMGVCGKMGRAIFHSLYNDKDVEITGAAEIEGHPAIDMDAGIEMGVGNTGVSISDSIDKSSGNADVVVDFTSPESTLAHARYCNEKGIPMVIGTTGFLPDQRDELNRLGRGFPCVISPNMSIGVNVLFEITRKTASLLGRDFDAEIVEVHHRNKSDSPSGTALGLGGCLADGLGLDFESAARFERYGNIGKRKDDEIGIQTVRGGDVVGDHTVMFLGKGERIELTHRALSRDNFSSGVLRAVKWLPGKPRGIYSMKQVLGLDNI